MYTMEHRYNEITMFRSFSYILLLMGKIKLFGFSYTDVRYVEVPPYKEKSIDFLHQPLSHFVNARK